MRRSCAALFVALLITAAVPGARADAKRVAVVRVAAAEADLRSRAASMTKAIVATVQSKGYEAEVTDVSLPTVKTMLGCPELTGCLRELGATLGADVVVAGRLSRGGGGTSLTLLWVTEEDVYRDKFAVPTEGAAAAMKPALRAFAENRPYTVSPGRWSEPKEPDATDTVHDEVDADGDRDPGQGAVARADDDDDAVALPSPVGKTLLFPKESLILAGTGAVVLTAGAIALQAGLGRQADIDEAPTATVAELEALRDEEARARRLNVVGTTLVAAGVGALVASAVLAVRKSRTEPEPATSLTVSLPPGAPGSGVVVGIRGRL